MRCSERVMCLKGEGRKGLRRAKRRHRRSIRLFGIRPPIRKTATEVQGSLSTKSAVSARPGLLVASIIK